MACRSPGKGDGESGDDPDAALDADSDGYDEDSDGTSTWYRAAVTVSGEDVTIALDGTDYVSCTASGEAPIGAGVLGLYTYDNHGGLYYDDFEVSNP